MKLVNNGLCVQCIEYKGMLIQFDDCSDSKFCIDCINEAHTKLHELDPANRTIGNYGTCTWCKGKGSLTDEYGMETACFCNNMPTK